MNTQAHPPITRRRADIDFDPDCAEHGHFASRGVENFFNTVSLSFPSGERFFIESVQNYVDRIKDPELLEQTRLFIYQEAMHTKEHNRYNRLLKRLYPKTARIERANEKVCDLVRLLTPKATQLSITCAMEHFTATLANSLLTRQEWLIDQAHPAVAKLIAWHAAEEIEHKAVCFDVHQHLFGKGLLSYLNRFLGMVLVSLYFLTLVPIAVLLLGKDKRSGSKQHRAAASHATPQNGPGKESINIWKALRIGFPLKQYFDYYRPSFHPWDLDNAHLVEAWKQHYPDLGRISDGGT